MRNAALQLGAFLLVLQPASGAMLANSRSENPWVTAALAAEGRLDPLAALAAYREAARALPDDAFIQQKIAQQLSDATFLETSASERTRLATEALPHALRAVALDPQSAVARLSLAVLYGKLAVEGGVRSKIDYARRIRLHAEEALVLDPHYAWGWHVLGRWHVALADLGTAKRAVVALLFGGLPPASREEGIRHLEQAVKLEPEALVHHVELGFAYQLVKRTEDARASWKRALALPSRRIYDQNARERATSALAALPFSPP